MRGTFPVALAAGVGLVVLAPSTQARVTGGIFALTAALLFGVSALYHRGRWSERASAVLRRLDHANIFLIIAGTYTPFTILLLDRDDARILLSLVWVGALVGVAFRVLWVGASRWLYVPVYIALGWVAAFWLPQFASRGGIAVLVLIIVGGLLYSLGGVVYALKRPNPSPALVRLPRDLPRLHGGRLRRPPRRGVAGGVRRRRRGRRLTAFVRRTPRPGRSHGPARRGPWHRATASTTPRCSGRSA